LLPKSVEELDEIKEIAKSMVKKRALVSSGAVLIPAPGVDIAADVALLLELLPGINRKFGLTPEQIDELDPQLKALMYGIIKKVGSTLVGKVVTEKLISVTLQKVAGRMVAKQLVKYIPFFGQALAAALSGGAMIIVGNSHIDDCYDIAFSAIKARST